MLHENVQGNRVVKLFGQEGYEAGRFHEQDERIFRLFMRSSRMRSLPITELLAGIALAGIIWYGGASVIAGTRTQGSFFAFLATVAFLFEPFKKLVRDELHHPAGHRRARSASSRCSTRQPEVVDRPERDRCCRASGRASSSTTCGSSTSPAGRCCAASTCASRRARSWRWSA